MWTTQPSHAYALIAFVVIFVGLAGLLLMRHRLSVPVLLAWSVVQFLLLLGNIALGLGSGFTPQEAAEYLFGLAGFVAFFILVVLLVPASVVAYLGERKAG